MAFGDCLLPLLNGLGTLAESQLTIEVWVYFLAALHDMWDLRSPIRDRTCAPCSGSTEY